LDLAWFLLVAPFLFLLLVALLMPAKTWSEIQPTQCAAFTHPRLALNKALATPHLLVIILLVVQPLPTCAQLPQIALYTLANQLDVHKWLKIAPNDQSVKLPVARRVKEDACICLFYAMTLTLAPLILAMMLKDANTLLWFAMTMINVPKILALPELAVLMLKPFATMDSVALQTLATSQLVIAHTLQSILSVLILTLAKFGLVTRVLPLQ